MSAERVGSDQIATDLDFAESNVLLFRNLKDDKILRLSGFEQDLTFPSDGSEFSEKASVQARSMFDGAHLFLAGVVLFCVFLFSVARVLSGAAFLAQLPLTYASLSVVSFGFSVLLFSEFWRKDS